MFAGWKPGPLVLVVAVCPLAACKVPRVHLHECGNGAFETGEICFEFQGEYAAGIDPCDLVVHDFDGDGLDDAAVPNSDPFPPESWPRVATTLRSAGDALEEPVSYQLQPGLPVQITKGDYDGDGIIDLAVGKNDPGEHGLALLLGNGDGSFQGPPLYVEISERVSAMASADIDGDGRTDLALLTPFGLQLYLDPTVAGPPAAELSLSFGTDLAFGQLGGSEPSQLAVTSGEGRLYIFDVDPLGGVSELSEQTFSPSYLSQLAVGDVDSDGDQDLVISSQGNPDPLTVVDGEIIIASQDDGSFEETASIAAAPGAYSLALAHLNLDDQLDIAVSNLDDNTITVYGSRDGEWRERALLQTGTLPISIAFGEFNGDGRPDLYVANQLGDSVGIFVAAP